MGFILENLERTVGYGTSNKYVRFEEKRCNTQETRSSGYPIRSDTNHSVQSQKQASGLKFWKDVEEELYYPCRRKQRR